MRSRFLICMATSLLVAGGAMASAVVSKNLWADEVSVVKTLSETGYHTVLTGKWYTGELPGMRPHEVGFDEFQGYYASQ